LICIKPKVIQRPEANRVGVLIGRKGFRAPCDKVWIGGVNIPRCGAIPLVVLRPVVCPGGMLRRRVKGDVTNIDSGPHRHAEGLNSAIQVLVKEGIIIVPDSL
jgi:hypothetical protein